MKLFSLENRITLASLLFIGVALNRLYSSAGDLWVLLPLLFMAHYCITLFLSGYFGLLPDEEVKEARVYIVCDEITQDEALLLCTSFMSDEEAVQIIMLDDADRAKLKEMLDEK